MKKKNKISKNSKFLSVKSIEMDIALARVLPKRFDFNGNTIGFCPKF